MSKRHLEEIAEEEEEEERAKRPRVCAPWGELCGDLVRALVCTEPSLLPALYLVCKAYKELLDSEPNGLHWQRYFTSVPGYSDYAPGVNFHDWRTLVWMRKELSPSYYLKVQHPVWPCGLQVPESILSAVMLPCKCGTQHSSRTPITTWIDLKLRVTSLPKTEVSFHKANTHVGCTWRMGGPSWFSYDVKAETISRMEETNSPLMTIRRTLAAARAADIPADKQWQVARFVGFI